MNTKENEEPCPEYDKCIERRIVDAEMRGVIKTKLESIEKTLVDLAAATVEGRGDIKQLYFRMGLLSGIVSLIVSLISNHYK